MADDVLRVGNFSGFYGDRFTAFREQLEGGRLDVLTGDLLAELTMLILWRTRQRAPGRGYARTFLRQVREDLDLLADRRVRVVTNAGGLDPAGLAGALREVIADAGHDLRVAHLEGDDLLPRLGELRDRYGLHHLDRGTPLAEHPVPPLTANAYLGAWGIVAALEEGADIVVCPRVTDASLVVGPAAWRFGWDRDEWDRLAGAVVAGHVLECGAQATGGNYSFFEEVPGLEHPGFPIAEVAADGSSVITKHPGTGGQVSVGTVTAQLLYEIGGPGYLNPDVTTDLTSVRLRAVGPDRVRISGVRGAPPTAHLKVSLNSLGGFRNTVTFLLTGLDVEAKADLVRRSLAARVDLSSIAEVDWQLIRSDHPDAASNAEAIATLRVTVKDPDPDRVGRRAFSDAAVELALANYPGFTTTGPPTEAEPFGIHWPALVPKDEVEEVVVTADGRRLAVAQTPGADPAAPPASAATAAAPAAPPDTGPTRLVPLGTLLGARSGDKGGNANVGVWARSEAAHRWLVSFLTVDRFVELVPDARGLRVDRHELPNLAALNFVVHGLLGLGVSASTRIDPQAKGLAEYLRSRVVPVPTALLP